MWIFTTKGFYSIVRSDTPEHMLVRSRFRGDIEKLFPDIKDAKVSVTPDRDYLYRAVVHRDTVMLALANLIPDIDYPNFKDAVLDERRHPAYGEVWYTMYLAGDQRTVSPAVDDYDQVYDQAYEQAVAEFVARRHKARGTDDQRETASSLPPDTYAVLRTDAVLGEPASAKPLSRMRQKRVQTAKIRRRSSDTGK